MRVTVGWSFLLAVLAWVAVAGASLTLIRSAWSVLVLLVVAATFAGLIRAPVEALARWVPRVGAVLLVVAGVTVVAGAVTANETWQLERHATALSRSLPERVEQLDEGSDLRQFLVEARVVERAQEVLDRVPRLVVLGTADSGESARLGFDVLLVLILTVYATANGPQVVRGLTGAITDGRRRRLVHESLGDGLDRAAAYVRRSLLWGAASGAVVAVLALALELTGPTTLAVWAGVWSIVPVLGVAVGYAPIVALAGFDDPGAAVVVAAVGLLWWLLSWPVVDRLVSRPTVRLGPLLVTVALAIGLQFGWLVGSLVSLFLVAWGSAFLSEVGRRTGPDETPLGELTEDPADAPVPDGAGPRPATAAAPAWPGTAAAGPTRLVLASLDLRSGARATVLVVSALVGLALVRSAQPGPTWIVLGVVIGMALDPAARWVCRRARLPRGPAVAAVVGGTILALAGLLVVAAPSMLESLRQFDQQVVEVAGDVEQLPLVGDELQRRGVGDELRRLIDRVPDELAADPTPVTRGLRTAGDVLVGSFWTLLVAVATLVDGRRIAGHARTLLPSRHRERGDEAVTLVYDTLVRYAAGSALVSGLVGLAVFATAAALGIPLAPVLGIWALLWTFVPQVGGFLAAVPLVFLALVESTTDAIIALAAYGVAWQVKNRILMPVVIGRAVNLSPVVAMTAVLVGGAAAGLVGAVLATPVVGTARLAHHHFRPRPAGGGGGTLPSHDPGQPAGATGPLRAGDRVDPEARGGVPGGHLRAPAGRRR